MAISISEVYPEAELKESAFSAGLTRIAMNLVKFHSGAAQQSLPEIEITFMLTGSHSAPDFTGMRIRRYSPSEQIVQIESAVPKAMINSADASEYIIAVLMDGVENAAELLAEIKVAFDLPVHMDLIARLAESKMALS